jgi:hypothetical protein
MMDKGLIGVLLLIVLWVAAAVVSVVMTGGLFVVT